MERGDWSDLAVFAAIADTGSFTKAAARLGVSASAVSHAMRTMEARLGVRLLNRTTRSVAPTDAGERLLARLLPAMDEVAGALAALDAQRERPSGRVRISAHRAAAMQCVLPRLARFAIQFPEVTVELVVDDGLTDIVAGRFDAGIRHEQMLDKDMVSIRLGEAERLAIVAAPAYFARSPPPRRPEDLLGHRCLTYRYTTSGVIHRWRFEREDRAFSLDAPAGFVTNDIDVLLEAALRGIGLAILPHSYARRHVESGALVSVLRSGARCFRRTTSTTRTAARSALHCGPSSTRCASRGYDDPPMNQPDAHRRRPDLWPTAVLIALVGMIALGWWFFPALQRYVFLQDCVASARTNCF